VTVLLRRRHDLVCQEMVELVTEYLDGSLSRADRRGFEAHLRQCPNCTAYLEQMRATIRAMGRLEPDDLSPAAREELIDLYRAWRAEGRQG
jgi:anti-sigma factor RsiW